MYNYTTTTYLGYTIHIVTAKSDSTHDVRLSVMALPAGENVKKLAINWHDSALETSGWTRKAVINGGLFFEQGATTYANGIEVSSGVVNEGSWSGEDDNLDAVIGFGYQWTNPSILTVDTQLNLKNTINNYFGALTGAFGLLKEGNIYQGDTIASYASFSSKTGRSFIGVDSSGVFYFVSVSGYAGFGLTGSELTSLAQSLNLYNAVALDGGGSVSLIYDDDWKASTTRTIKNAIGIYVKNVIPTPTPITPPAEYLSLPTPKKGSSNVLRQYIGGQVVQKIMRIDPANNNKIVAYRDTTSCSYFPQAFGTSYNWSNSGATNTPTNMTSTNNPYIASFTASNRDGVQPFYLLGSGSDYSINPGSNGFQSVTYTIQFNARISFQSMTMHGWGMNHSYLSSVAGALIQASNDGTNWTTIFSGNIPHSWTGSNINYSDPPISSASEYTQKTNMAAAVRDSHVTYTGDYLIGGPGAQTINFNYSNYYFKYIKLTWLNNWEYIYYGTQGGLDKRYYWDESIYPNAWADWKKSGNNACKFIYFNVNIQPL